MCIGGKSEPVFIRGCLLFTAVLYPLYIFGTISEIPYVYISIFYIQSFYFAILLHKSGGMKQGTHRNVGRSLHFNYLLPLFKSFTTTVLLFFFFLTANIPIVQSKQGHIASYHLNATLFSFCRFTTDHCVHFCLLSLEWIWERARVCIRNYYLVIFVII